LDAARENGEGLMANETGKFDVPALGNLTPGIPNRRQFMLLGASAAAGMTVPASALAQTERPTNPPDKPRGQVIAALSQEPTDRR
jgi:peptide/nickel transport system substrate-binding protein